MGEGGSYLWAPVAVRSPEVRGFNLKKLVNFFFFFPQI